MNDRYVDTLRYFSLKLILPFYFAYLLAKFCFLLSTAKQALSVLIYLHDITTLTFSSFCPFLFPFHIYSLSLQH